MIVCVVVCAVVFNMLVCVIVLVLYVIVLVMMATSIMPMFVQTPVATFRVSSTELPERNVFDPT